MSDNKCFKILKKDGTFLIVCPNEPIETLRPKIYEMVELTTDLEVLKKVILVDQTIL